MINVEGASHILNNINENKGRGVDEESKRGLMRTKEKK